MVRNVGGDEGVAETGFWPLVHRCTAGTAHSRTSSIYVAAVPKEAVSWTTVSKVRRGFPRQLAVRFSASHSPRVSGRGRGAQGGFCPLQARFETRVVRGEGACVSVRVDGLLEAVETQAHVTQQHVMPGRARGVGGGPPGVRVGAAKVAELERRVGQTAQQLGVVG